MKRILDGIGEAITWFISFLAGEDLTRLDRTMRIIGFSVTIAVVIFLTVWEALEK